MVAQRAQRRRCTARTPRQNIPAGKETEPNKAYTNNNVSENEPPAEGGLYHPCGDRAAESDEPEAPWPLRDMIQHNNSIVHNPVLREIVKKILGLCGWSEAANEQLALLPGRSLHRSHGVLRNGLLDFDLRQNADE